MLKKLTFVNVSNNLVTDSLTQFVANATPYLGVFAVIH